MRKVMTSIAALLLVACTLAAQDNSVETFNAIRLEHSANPGESITLSAPSGLTGYSVVLPATPAPTDGARYSFSLSGTGNGMSWYQTPFGATKRVAFFKSDEELIGSTNFQWDDTTKTLSLSSTTNKPLLSLSKNSDLSAGDTILKFNGKYKSTGGNRVDISLLQFAADGSQLANGSTVTGLDINVQHGSSSTPNPSRATGLKIKVSGADTNRAAIISGGNVGVNTDYPKVYLDVAGDVAYRENSNDAMNFDGKGNRFSFLRIGSSTTQMVEIKGIKGGYDGKVLTMYNATGQTIRLANKAANDSTNSIKSGANADLLLLPGNSYQLIYSGTEKLWIVAYSGPGDLAQLGNKEVNITGDGETLPSSVASYIQINTPNTNNVNTYNVALEDGTTPGQILVVQNKGPKKISFDTTNAVWDNTTDLQDGESIILVWNVTAWVQVARASN